MCFFFFFFFPVPPSLLGTFGWPPSAMSHPYQQYHQQQQHQQHQPQYQQSAALVRTPALPPIAPPTDRHVSTTNPRSKQTQGKETEQKMKGKRKKKKEMKEAEEREEVTLCSFLPFFFFLSLTDDDDHHHHHHHRSINRETSIDQLAGRLDRTEQSTRALLQQALKVQTDIDDSFQLSKRCIATRSITEPCCGTISGQSPTS
jgi:cytochrome P450